MSVSNNIEQKMEQNSKQILEELSQIKGASVSSLVTLCIPANYQCL